MTIPNKNRLLTYSLKIERLLIESSEDFSQAATTEPDESDQFDRQQAQGTVKVLRARDLYEAMLKEFGRIIQAWPVLGQTANYLVEALVAAGQWAGALKLYRETKLFVRAESGKFWRALIGARLVAFLADSSQLVEAARIYRTLSALGHSGDIAIERAKAAFHLLTVAISDGEPLKAKPYYEDIMGIAKLFLSRGRASLTLVASPKAPSSRRSSSWSSATTTANLIDTAGLNQWPSGQPNLALVSSKNSNAAPIRDLDASQWAELTQTLAKGSINMIAGYVIQGQADAANAIYEAFKSLDLLSPWFLARGACDLVYAFARQNRWDMALQKYDYLASLDSDPHDYHAKAAANLVVLYSESRMWPEAQALLKELANVVPKERAQKEKARAVTALTLSYLDYGQWDAALALFSELNTVGSGFSLANRAEAAINLILGLAQAGRLSLTRLVFERLTLHHEFPGYEMDLAACALGLVDYYSRNGQKDEALYFHQYIMALSGSEEIYQTQARSYFALITFLSLAGEIEEALDYFQKMKNLPAIDLVETEISKAMVNLISALGGADRLAEARELFEAIGRLKPSEAINDNHGVAAYNLLCDYAKRLLVLEGLELMSFMGQLTQTSLIIALKAESAVVLIQSSADLGQFKMAETLYQSLFVDLCPQDYLKERTRAASHLINVVTSSLMAKKPRRFLQGDLTRSEKLDLARYVFVSMDGLLPEGENLTNWAGSLVNLVTSLELAGLTLEAQKVFATLTQLSENRGALKPWAKAAFNLIAFRAEAGQFVQALELLLELEKRGGHSQVRPHLAEAIVNLVGNLGQVGRLEEARQIYESSKAYLGQKLQSRVYQAKTLYNLILGHLKAGHLNLAAELFAQFAPSPELKAMSPQLVEVAMELIFALAAAGSIAQAQAIHKTTRQVLAKAGWPSDWASFKKMVNNPPGHRGGPEKLALITSGRLRQTVQKLQEKRQSREIKAAPNSGLSAPCPGVAEVWANLKPWTFDHHRWNRR
ncbi:MAG: hypothetical protein LBT38_05960 [Deltaproteobacteria bacterium]|jgi:tetratricopeptide (TPR) repeat protein|nr:hypothetical protein [Deltaproteobacteria bacterium]